MHWHKRHTRGLTFTCRKKKKKKKKEVGSRGKKLILSWDDALCLESLFAARICSVLLLLEGISIGFSRALVFSVQTTFLFGYTIWPETMSRIGQKL